MTRALIEQMLEALRQAVPNNSKQSKEQLNAIKSASEYLATELVPVQSPARKEFILRLRDRDNVTLETSRLYMQKAANMLQADAQEIAVMEHQVEILTDELSRCEKQAKRVPMTVEDIFLAVPGLQDCFDDPYDQDKTGNEYGSIKHDMIRLARAIEAHHGITPADKPTGDEHEDLYALALKADNWGQP